MQENLSWEKFQNSLKSKKNSAVYYLGSKCGVCSVLEPKIALALQNHFPNIDYSVISYELNPEIPSQQQIFTFPAFVFYHYGQELFRKAGTFGIKALLEEINLSLLKIK